MKDIPFAKFPAAARFQIKLRCAAAAALVAVACGLGGCASSASVSGSYAQASYSQTSYSQTSYSQAPGGTTVAFESIDGPPPQVFDRMVNVLDSESKLRNLQIVSREGAASYRVKSYLAAEIIRGRTSIAWVWDVYDRDQQRSIRLSGEEPTNKTGRDAWAAADDLTLRKIAQAGLSGLSAMVNGTAPADDSPPPVSTPVRRGPAVAEADQPSSAVQVGAMSYTAQ